MAQTTATSETVSAFCNGVAVMLAAGIQVDEAVGMLADGTTDAFTSQLFSEVYAELADGASLAFALASTGAFPEHAVSMVDVGEKSGRLEQVLSSLAAYYEEEGRMFAKMRASVGYPAALLCLMSVIVAFTVWAVLPTFEGVYASLAGSLTAGSFGAVEASIVIGWIALVATLACTAAALAAVILGATADGRQRLVRILAVLPWTRGAVYELDLSRFVSCLAIYVAAGSNTDDAMGDALATVTDRRLRAQLVHAHKLMLDVSEPRSLNQAVAEVGLLQPVYARMLAVSSRSGSLDQSLGELSALLFSEAVQGLDAAIDGVEPALAALVTVAVGATLVSVMLPLVGIMGSIG